MAAPFPLETSSSLGERGPLPKPASSEAKQQPSTSNPYLDAQPNKFNKKDRATELSNNEEQQTRQQPQKGQKKGMEAPRIEREGDLEHDLRSTPRNPLTLDEQSDPYFVDYDDFNDGDNLNEDEIKMSEDMLGGPEDDDDG